MTHRSPIDFSAVRLVPVTSLQALHRRLTVAVVLMVVNAVLSGMVLHHMLSWRGW